MISTRLAGFTLLFILFAPALSQNTTIQVPCALPDGIEGEWLSTLWEGTTTFTNESFTSPSGLGYTTLKDMQCYRSNSTSGDFVFRSTKTFKHLDLDFYIVVCVNIKKISDDNLETVVKTDRLGIQEDEPIGMHLSGRKIDNYLAQFCKANKDKWIHGVFIRKGKVNEAALECPKKIHGNFNATFTNDPRKRRCPGGATVTSCQNPKSVVFDFSSCDTNETNSTTSPMSGKDSYLCIGTQSQNILLYRTSNDTQELAPFSCMRTQAGSDNGTLNVNHTAGGCGGTWKPTKTPLKGITSTIVKTASCEASGSAANTTKSVNMTGQANATDHGNTKHNVSGINGTDTSGHGNNTLQANNTSPANVTDGNASNNTKDENRPDSGSDATNITIRPEPSHAPGLIFVPSSFVVVAIATLLTLMVANSGWV